RSNHRRRNALATGGRALAGTTYSVSIRTPEILDKLEQHPIWKERAEEKARGEQAGILVGTGVACATKNYGTGGDCSLASVEIAPDGRIAIHCDGVEIGTGIGTAAANRVAAHLGSLPDQTPLTPLTPSCPLPPPRPHGSEGAGRGGAQSALGACDQLGDRRLDQRACGTHPAAEAARVVFRFGLWPAALELWGIAPKDPRANQWEKARWKDGQLI